MTEEKEMYSKTLIDTYMRERKLSQYKQAATELGISKSYLSDICNDRNQLTDEQGIFIATECNLDPAEVLLKLAEARAKTPKAKSIWAAAVKNYCTGAKAASCAGLGLIAAFTAANLKFALCVVMVNKSRTRETMNSPEKRGVLSSETRNDRKHDFSLA